MEDNNDIRLLMPILEKVASQFAFVLELGPAQGNGSTRAFAKGLSLSKEKGKLFISVDIRDYMEEKPELDYWELILGDTRIINTMEKVFAASKGRRADLIFIDTHHTYEQMEQELATWEFMANEKTVWLFHDTHMMGEYNHMTDAIKEFAEKMGFHYEQVTDDSHGLGMMYDLWRPEL